MIKKRSVTAHAVSEARKYSWGTMLAAFTLCKSKQCICGSVIASL